jgi:hypothetical protein
MEYQMLTFKEYSQLNENPDVLAHSVRHLVNHEITKKFRNKVGDVRRAAHFFVKEHTPNIMDGYAQAAGADFGAPDVGGPAVVHSIMTAIFDGKSLIKSWEEHLKTATEIRGKQRALGLSK